jgi:hypothetical protein
MTSPDSNPNQIDANPVFATTRWSVVLAAGIRGITTRLSGQRVAQLGLFSRRRTSRLSRAEILYLAK